jgi:thioredoxin reductase
VRSDRIAGLEAARGKLARVRFASGEALRLHSLFFGSRPRQTCDLAARLGALFNEKGAILASHRQQTGVPGLYVAGDADRDVQLAVIAAAEGVKAAVAIHADLDAERLASLTTEPLPPLRTAASRR